MPGDQCGGGEKQVLFFGSGIGRGISYVYRTIEEANVDFSFLSPMFRWMLLNTK